MIAIDTEYVSEIAVEGSIPGPRPDVKTVYCEIMQIGAVKLDSSGREVESLNIVVKPSFIFHIPEWLNAMTGMTDEKRRTGVSFGNAIEELAQFIGSERDVWTYAGDWFVFSNAAKKHGIKLPFYEFSLVKPKLIEWGVTEKDFNKIGIEMCSGNLHKVLGIELPGEELSAHDAIHDARSLAHSVYYLRNKKEV